MIPAHPAYLVHVLGPTLLIGAGLGQMLLPTTISATAGLAQHEAGLASGLVSAARQIGGAVGLAALVTAASAATGHASGPVAVVHGYHVALAADAGIAVLAAATALFLPAVGKSSSRTGSADSPAAPLLRQGSTAAGESPSEGRQVTWSG